MKRKLFILTVGIFLLSGCESPTQNELSTGQKNQSNQNQITQEYIQQNSEVKEFIFPEVKFSLFIPKGLSVANYTQNLQGLNIIDDHGYGLRITVEGLDNKTFEQVKNEFIKNASGKVNVSFWHKQGYELIFPGDVPQDAMVRINRTFLFPVENSYLVLNEIAPDLKDNSLSSSIKVLADSLTIL